MPYTPITCTKAGEVHVRLKLAAPFVDWTVFPVHAPNFAHIKYNSGTGAIEKFASYIDNGTNQSFLSDEVTATAEGFNFGGFYTGSKLMAHTRVGTDWWVGYVNHAYADADNPSSAAMTLVNLGNGGVAPVATTATDGPHPLDIWGESEAGGDRISWLEGRTTEVHILTATTAALSRKQAFEIEAGESWKILRSNTSGMMFDGTKYRFIGRIGDSGSYYQTAPYTLLMVEFTPTTVGNPFDYEKFELTFDDATLNTAFAAYGTGATVSGDYHYLSAYDPSAFGNLRRIELSADCTTYTEYIFTGNAAVEAMVQTNVPAIIRGADPADFCVIGYSFYSSVVPDPWAPGTYHLGGDCVPVGGQGHIHAKKRTLGPPIITTGNLIPSGDMQGGSDKFLTSGDMQDGTDKLLWQEIK